MRLNLKSISSQITLLTLTIFLLFAGVSFYSFYKMKSFNENLKILNSRYYPLIYSLNTLKNDILYNMEYLEKVTEHSTNPFLIFGKQNFIEDLSLFSEKIQKQTLSIETYINSLTERENLQPQFENIKEALTDYHILLNTIVGHLKSSQFQKLKTDQDALFLQKFNWKQNTSNIVEATQTSLRNKTVYIQSEIHKNTQMIWYGLIFTCFLSLFLIFFSYKTLKPIQELTREVRQLSHNVDSPHILTHAKYEIGELVRSINQMIFSIKERDKKLKTQSQKLKNAYHDIQERNIHLEFLSNYYKDIRERLIQSERLATVGKMSAQVAHEIRNPLNSIQLNLDYLKEKFKILDSSRPKPGDDKGVETIEEVFISLSSQIERLKTMTDNYLKFTKMPESEKQKIKLQDLLKKLCDFYKAPNIHISTEIEKNIPFVQGDPSQLNLAFLNILKNASEAMPRGGNVKIKALHNQTQKMIELYFNDDGEGLTQQEYEKIFLPFYTTKAQGSGLGLSLTQQIIHEHNGSIECFPNQPLGTTFKVSLPTGK
ncbi:MAG: HAMP domain-containing protein [Deltaproteobacteria bacterium]|nr:HAMP domain-containing protein [Deltaproteobacteria bacterium]